MNRKEQAIMLHRSGCNCAQSVACVFCNVMGANLEEVFKLTEGLGFGLGCMETCGAVTAMAVVAGMKNSDGNIDNPTTKKETYKITREMVEQFKQKNGSIICKEIKGVDGGKMLRSCDGCIEDAVEILDKYLLGL